MAAQTKAKQMATAKKVRKDNRREYTRTKKQKAYIGLSLVSLSLVPLFQSHSLGGVCHRNLVHLF